MYKSTILVIILKCSYFFAISNCDNQEQKPAIISVSGVDDIIKNLTYFRSRLSKLNGHKTKQGVEDPTVIVSLPLVYLFAPKRHKPRTSPFKASSLVKRSKPAKPSSNGKPSKPVAKHSSKRKPSKPVAKHSSKRKPSKPVAKHSSKGEPSNTPATISEKRDTPENLFFWTESTETVTTSSWEKHSKPLKLFSDEHSALVKSPGRLLSQPAKNSSWKEPNKPADSFLWSEHNKPAKTSSREEHIKPVILSSWEEHSQYLKSSGRVNSGGRNKQVKLSSWGGRSKTGKPFWGDPTKFSEEETDHDPLKFSWSQLAAKSGRRLKGGVPEPDPKTAPNLNDYVRVLAKNDMLWLNFTTESIKDELNLTVNMAPIVKTMLKNYVKNINRHLGSLKRIYSIRKYDVLEKDLVYINLVDASSRVVYNELKLWWNQVVDAYDTYLNPETITQVSEQIHKSSIQHTKDEFKTLCLTHKICRPFPAFSDHLAGLCSEVLKLSDEKLSEFVNTLYVVIKGRTEFYKFIMGEELSEDFGKKTLSLIKGDVYDVRETVSVFRGLITQRFYPLESSDQTIEEKTKAGRILIHLIDSTFAKEDEDAMSLHFHALKESLQDWAADFRNDVETILYTTMIYVSDVLEKHWDRETREQTRSVLQLLLKDGSVTVVR